MLTVLTQKPPFIFGNVVATRKGSFRLREGRLLAVPANGIILWRRAELEEKPWPNLPALYLIQQSWRASP